MPQPVLHWEGQDIPAPDGTLITLHDQAGSPVIYFPSFFYDCLCININRGPTVFHTRGGYKKYLAVDKLD